MSCQYFQSTDYFILQILPNNLGLGCHQSCYDDDSHCDFRNIYRTFK
jgi:hypothetical protein